MRMRRAADSSDEIINMTPLIDMMFIMVIFFALSSSFREEERDLQVSLPENAPGTTLSATPKVIVVNVRKSGAYVVNNQQVTLEELVEKIRAAVREDKEQKVLVRGDEHALHGYVAQAVAAAKRAGVNEANIGYKLPE